MPEHINVISYLLGAIVFSVGFLSARLHASADAQRQQVSDASWRVREIRAQGGRLAPDELGAVLSVARSSGDSIASLLRLLNLALVGAVLIVAADFLSLVGDGAEHSPHAVFLAAILGGAALAVGIVGEVDAQHLSRSLARELAQTSLGHIGQLELALAQGDLVSARAEVAVLERTFPDWGLLVELRALVAHLDGDPDLALRTIVDYLDGSGDDVYISPIVGAAAAIALDRPESALGVLDDVAERRGLYADERTLLHALRLRAGHLDEVVDGSAPPDSPTTLPQIVPAVSRPAIFARVGVEEIARQSHGSVLDVRVVDFAPLVDLVEDLRRWNASESGELHVASGPLAVLRQLVADGDLTEDSLAIASACIEETDDSAAIETCGIAFLIGGHPKDAVRALERGMRLNPKSPRIHWAHAIGCMYWGWWDKADESLGRAAALDADDIVVRLSRRRLGVDSAPEEPVVLPAGLSQAERLQLALVGMEIAPQDEDPSLRFGLVAEAIALARERAQTLRRPQGVVGG